MRPNLPARHVVTHRHEPDGTEPEDAEPDGTKPDGTKPDGTEPDGTKPDGGEHLRCQSSLFLPAQRLIMAGYLKDS